MLMINTDETEGAVQLNHRHFTLACVHGASLVRLFHLQWWRLNVSSWSECATRFNRGCVYAIEELQESGVRLSHVPQSCLCVNLETENPENYDSSALFEWLSSHGRAKAFRLLLEWRALNPCQKSNIINIKLNITTEGELRMQTH